MHISVNCGHPPHWRVSRGSSCTCWGPCWDALGGSCAGQDLKLRPWQIRASQKCFRLSTALRLQLFNTELQALIGAGVERKLDCSWHQPPYKVSLCLNESPLRVTERERPCGVPIKLCWLVNKQRNSEISAVPGNSIQGVKGFPEPSALRLIVSCSACAFPSYSLLKSHIAANTHLGFDYGISSTYMYKTEPTVPD